MRVQKGREETDFPEVMANDRLVSARKRQQGGMNGWLASTLFPLNLEGTNGMFE